MKKDYLTGISGNLWIIYERFGKDGNHWTRPYDGSEVFETREEGRSRVEWLRQNASWGTDKVKIYYKLVHYLGRSIE